METLRKVLEHALAGAEEVKAFATIQNQPGARCLIGLLIAQGRSFGRARQSRKQVFEYLAEQKVDVTSDTSVWKAITTIKQEQWEEWGVAASVPLAVAALQHSLKSRSLKEIIIRTQEEKQKQVRIGPWTRKAFLIMTASDEPGEIKGQEPEILLTEDSWVRQRWGEIVRGIKLKVAEYPLTLETCARLDLHPIQLSRLLWRLTKDGIVRLLQSREKKNKLKRVADWFIQ